MINKKVQFNFPENIPKRCLMFTLCSNCIKPTLKLLPFKQLWKCSKVVGNTFGHFQVMFRSLWKIVKDLQRLHAGMFCEIPVMTRRTQKEVSCLWLRKTWQIKSYLWCYEEILWGVLLASCLHYKFKYSPLIIGVHTLKNPTH